MPATPAEGMSHASPDDAQAIGALERCVADWAASQPRSTVMVAEKLSFRAAIVGAVPAGLTCAADLALSGVSVTVYEALHDAGGVLQYGIPQFRLPKEIVSQAAGPRRASCDQDRRFRCLLQCASRMRGDLD
jgi:NADPH-dependent glutamate synthase beta subunit-like oxidoreductase